MRRTPDYTAGNHHAAEIILATPATFGAGLAEWAERWQAAHPARERRWQRPAVAAQDGEQMRLGFKTPPAEGAR